MRRCIFGVLALLCGLHVQADELKLQLTQGVNGAIPVAVLPFSGATLGQENLGQVINKDLANSGEFKLTAKADLPEQPLSAQKLKIAKWQALGVDAVAMGQVQQVSQGKVKVHFELIDAFKSQAVKHGPPQIAYMKNQTFTVSVHSLHALGHHLSDEVYQALTGHRGVFSTRLAYIDVVRAADKPAHFYLKVSDYDGGEPQTLLDSTQPIMSPAWAPDGKSLAYVSFENRFPAIYTVNLATGQRHKIAQFRGINGAPSWSPNGKAMAIVLSKTGAPKLYLKYQGMSHVKQLTWGASIDTEPSFSPQGKAIVFTSNRQGGPQLYRYDLATHVITRLTYDGSYNAHGSYSADGKFLAMLHKDDNGFNVAVQNLDTDDFKVLTTAGDTQSPSFAPNGRLVVYSEQVGGKGILGIVSTNGKVQLHLAAGQGNEEEPAWSPYLS